MVRVPWRYGVAAGSVVLALLSSGCLASFDLVPAEETDPSFLRITGFSGSATGSTGCPITAQVSLTGGGCTEADVALTDWRCAPPQFIIHRMFQDGDEGDAAHRPFEPVDHASTGPGEPYVHCTFELDWRVSSGGGQPGSVLHAEANLLGESVSDSCQIPDRGTCSLNGTIDGVMTFDGPDGSFEIPYGLEARVKGWRMLGPLEAGPSYRLMQDLTFRT